VTEAPILFFDGLCPLCDGAVRWLLRADRHGRLRFAPLQGATATQRLPPRSSLPDALVLWTPAGIRVRSDAVLGALEATGGLRVAYRLLRLLPRPLRDWLYDAVARRRTRWFGRWDACRVPTAAERQRFLP
jgi:predicted DCC family thiol-disulfide oxidoreductase YuxK